MSLCAYSQNITLKPVLIKNDKGEIVYYAFTKEQAIDILKTYERNSIHKELIDSLETHVATLHSVQKDYKAMQDSLESANKTYYKITANYNKVTQKYENMQVDLVSIQKSLEHKVAKKNKTIWILTGTNIAAILLVILILL